MKTITVKFLEDCAPKNGSGTSYQAGQQVDLREDSARHWISRRKAEAVNGDISQPPVSKDPDASFSDAAEARHNEKRRGRQPKERGENEAFATGDDA